MIRKILAAFGAVAIIGCNEVKEESYNSHTDAVRSGAIVRGVVPGCVPPEARSIHAAFDFATNEQWIRFEIAGTELESYRAKLLALNPTQRPQVSRPTGIDWWPDDLIGVLDIGKLETRGYSLRLSPGAQPAIIVFEGANAYCWLPPH